MKFLKKYSYYNFLYFFISLFFYFFIFESYQSGEIWMRVDVLEQKESPLLFSLILLTLGIVNSILMISAIIIDFRK